MKDQHRRIVDILKQQQAVMSDPIMSPDGKFMWTGYEWIPAPPTDPVSAQNEIVVLQNPVNYNATKFEPLPIEIPTYLSANTQVQRKKGATAGFLTVIGSVSVIALVIFLFVNRTIFFDNFVDEFSDWDGDGISDANDPDDDNDGYLDENDWYDQGDGGLIITFSKFQIWSGGNYDSGGNPDVYAYVGIGNGDCQAMQYFEYLDDINQDASVLYDWKEYVANIDEDQDTACVSVTIYDEDSWAPDDILDYVPGSSKAYQHRLLLSAGEGDIYVYEDNRGENELSILLEYEISRSAVVSA